MKTRKEKKWLIAYLTGRLDVKASSEVEDKLGRLVDDKNLYLILELKGVEYMSSSGFRTLISILRKLKARDGELRICCIQPEVSRIFELIELNSLFNVYKTEEDALAS